MRIPGYRKHKTGQAFVVIKGEHKYLGKHGSKASKAKYDRLIEEWLRRRDEAATLGDPVLSQILVPFCTAAHSLRIARF